MCSTASTQGSASLLQERGKIDGTHRLLDHVTECASFSIYDAVSHAIDVLDDLTAQRAYINRTHNTLTSLTSTHQTLH
jgi:hypothetical protein